MEGSFILGLGLLAGLVLLVGAVVVLVAWVWALGS